GREEGTGKGRTAGRGPCFCSASSVVRCLGDRRRRARAGTAGYVWRLHAAAALETSVVVRDPLPVAGIPVGRGVELRRVFDLLLGAADEDLALAHVDLLH